MILVLFLSRVKNFLSYFFYLELESNQVPQWELSLNQTSEILRNYFLSQVRINESKYFCLPHRNHHQYRLFQRYSYSTAGIPIRSIHV